MICAEDSPTLCIHLWNLLDLLCVQVPELPSFMLEPLESHKEDIYRSGPPSYEYSSMEVLSFPNQNDNFSNVKIDITFLCLHRKKAVKYLLAFYGFRTYIPDCQHNCVLRNIFYLSQYMFWTYYWVILRWYKVEGKAIPVTGHRYP
jgi:hypothetical protein